MNECLHESLFSIAGEKLMRWFTAPVLVVVVLLAGTTSAKKKKAPKYPPSPFVASTDPLTPEEERKTFHLPAGFEVQFVAAEPDIGKPINIAFDARGRLWMTQSVEYPYPAKEGKPPRDCVKILEDFGPNGRARKITTFADQLNIPIGVLPIGHGALVYSIPSIYRMVDTKGQGKADKREVLYGVYGHRDTHGMTGEFTKGFDGWVYACHGFSNTSTVKAADGSQITMQSGNTYRFKQDGSHVEYFTHGQVNPFGLCWDPLGNLYSCDCHSRPIYQLLRGAYYPSFEKGHDGLGFGPEVMTHDHGSTAIAGIAYYAADHFPAEFHGNLFVGNVVTNRINRDRPEAHGSTMKAIEQPDFVRSDDPWFRPVDIKLGPDGALYVADFYNRIIGHYEVPLDHPGRDKKRGRIWRIIYRGKDGKRKPQAPRADWTRAKTEELVQDLGHPNLTVRLIATNQLVERGGRPVAEAVLKVMQPKAKPVQRMHGLWILQRIHALDPKLLTAAAGDEDAGVRVHAMRVLEQRHDWPRELRDLALAGLKDKDPLVQRCAAAALGSHPAAANVQPLFDLRHKVPAEDTHLLHAVRMALRDQLLPAATWKELHPAKWSERDARAVADLCPGTPTAEAAGYLLDHIRRHAESGDTLYRYVHHIARYGTPDSGKTLLAFASANRPADLPHQRGLFKAVQHGLQERGAQLSPEVRGWGEALTRKLLDSKQKSEFVAGIDLAGGLQMKGLKDLLLTTASAAKEVEDRRTAALDSLAAIDARGTIPLLAKILVASSEKIGLREFAAGLLGKINQPEAQAELVKVLPTVPARLQNAIAVELARSRAGGEKLLETVAIGKASARILQEKLVELRLAETGIPRLKERIAALTKDLEPADKKLQDLLQSRRAGFLKAKASAARGFKVFEKNCAICHQIANKGSKIGPQLDGIGIRGLDRLLEDILDPNRNVDQAFRLTTLTLKNAQIRSGLLLREDGQVLVLADAQGKEVRVPKDQVDEKTVSQISPMPANFAEVIAPKDFDDLLAYLLEQKVAEKGKSIKTGKQ
jgi:putative heme-binding domain-containing protein